MAFVLQQRRDIIIGLVPGPYHLPPYHHVTSVLPDPFLHGHYPSYLSKQ